MDPQIPTKWKSKWASKWLDQTKCIFNEEYSLYFLFWKRKLLWNSGMNWFSNWSINVLWSETNTNSDCCSNTDKVLFISNKTVEQLYTFVQTIFNCTLNGLKEQNKPSLIWNENDLCGNRWIIPCHLSTCFCLRIRPISIY